MMKRIALITLAIVTSLSSWAQQAPFHKHYFVNPYLINPARVGESDRMNMFLTHRSQWVSVPGAPVTSTMTFDSPIKQGTNGFGLTLFTDQTDIFRRTGGSLAYGHKFNFGENVTLSLGAAANVFDNRIDFTKVVVLQETDPYLFQSVQNQAVLDGSGGMNLRIQRFNFGAALNHFGVERLFYDGTNNFANYRQEMFAQGTMSYKFLLGNSGNFGVMPVATFRYFDESPYQYDGNLILSYKDKIWVGGTYRSDYGMSVSAGLVIYDAITVGYSYDLITNSLKGNSGLSSELIVGIKLGKRQEEKEAEFVDTDNDGVADEFDLEPDTEEGAFVNFQGVTIKDKLGIEDFDTLTVKEVIYLDSTITEAFPESTATAPNIADFSTSFFFDFDKANLKTSEDDKMVELVNQIRNNPGAKVVITGHADRKGSEEYNMILGQKRAQEIATVLVNDFEVDPSQIISVISRGKSDPISKSRAYVNRRVDVQLVDPNMNIPTIQTPGGPGMQEMPVDQGALEEYRESQEPKGETVGDVPARGLLDDPNGDDGLFYTVQLGVFKNDVRSEYWQNVQPLYTMELKDGTTRYYSGQFASKDRVLAETKRMQEMGFNDAFPTAYYKGQRIMLEKAQELLDGIGPNILKEELRK